MAREDMGPVFGCARETILDSENESPDLSVCALDIGVPFGVINTPGVIFPGSFLQYCMLTEANSRSQSRFSTLIRSSNANFSPDSALIFSHAACGRRSRVTHLRIRKCSVFSPLSFAPPPPAHQYILDVRRPPP
jgi:hypothetical protein